MEDFSGAAVDEVEAERGGRATKASEHACALMLVVRVGTRIPIDEFAFQRAIHTRMASFRAVAVIAWGLPMRPASRR